MIKKLIPVFISFTVLILVLVFTSEKKEQVDDLSLWKINPDKITYTPPRSEKELYAKLKSGKMEFQRLETGFNNPLFFKITGEGGSIYEGNYQVKNLFQELSILKVKSLNALSPELANTYSIFPEECPRIELFQKDKSAESICLGELSRDKNRRYIATKEKIATTAMYIFDKFTGPSSSFRDRQYFHIAEDDINRITIQHENVKLNLEITPSPIKNTGQAKWYKISSGKLRVDPSDSSGVMNTLLTLSAVFYPDDEKAPGFPAALKEIEGSPSGFIEIVMLNGINYKLNLYSEIEINSQKYYTARREIEKVFAEYPSYVSVSEIKKLKDLALKINSSPEWKEPVKKGNGK